MKILPFENIKLREDVIEPIFKVTKHRWTDQYLNGFKFSRKR
jgi:hypothetical protein